MTFRKLLAILIVALSLTGVGSASATIVDQEWGLSYTCLQNGQFSPCKSGSNMTLSVRVLGELDFATGQIEQSAVVNVEIIDENGNQMYLGTPKGFKLSNGLRRVNVSVPGRVTRYLDSGIHFLEVRMYVSGPRFDTSYDEQFWIAINVPPPPPCSGEYCGGKG